MGWRAALAGLTLLGSMWTGGGAVADQTDGRLNDLFEVLAEAQHLDDATRAADRIWRIWIEHPDADVSDWMRRGMGAMNDGDLAAANEAFERVVRLAPDFAEGWNKRATVRYFRGDFDGSVSDIQRTLALEPRHFGALSGLGLIYIALEQPEGAAKALEAALEIFPLMPGGRERFEALKDQLKGRRL